MDKYDAELQVTCNVHIVFLFICNNKRRGFVCVSEFFMTENRVQLDWFKSDIPTVTCLPVFGASFSIAFGDTCGLFSSHGYAN